MAVPRLDSAALVKFTQHYHPLGKVANYMEQDYSQYDKSQPENNFTFNAYCVGSKLIRSRVPKSAIAFYMSRLSPGTSEVPYITSVGPMSFKHDKMNVRGIPNVIPGYSHNWCMECNFLVDEHPANVPCFGDIAVKNALVERAAWIGDSLIASLVRMHLLKKPGGGIDGVKYSQLTSGVSLASLYLKIKPYQAIAELVANGAAAATVADSVEAAFALSPIFSLAIQQALFGEASLSHITSDLLEVLRAGYRVQSIVPTAYALGFGYLHTFNKFDSVQEPFITYSQLCAHDATANHKPVYYRRIGKFCVMLNMPVAGFTETNSSEIYASREDFRDLIFC